jgi:hypothetical protein
LCNDILLLRYSAKNEFTIGTDLLWDYLALYEDMQLWNGRQMAVAARGSALKSV